MTRQRFQDRIVQTIWEYSPVIAWLGFCMLLSAAVLSGCKGSYDADRSLYQLRYGFPVVVPHPPKRAIPPLDLAKEKLAVEAYNKISLGISVVAVSLVVGLMMSNPFINGASQLGMMGGGTWAGIGFFKLWVSQYLILFCWAVGIGFLVFIVFRWRGADIRRAKLWLTSLRRPSTTPTTSTEPIR